MKEARLTLDVRGVPELIAGLRREMADLLRQEARAEASAYVRDRLLACAAAFEAGQRPVEGADGQ